MFEIESLRRLKEILLSFRLISGLSTNYEKTAIMRIGNLEGEVPEEIMALGFTVTNNIKLLGFHISNEGNMLDSNFIPIYQKISSIIRFWDRFYLSLHSKITVYKTLLLPQLNYIGTILMPTDNTIKNLSDLMENFVTQGLKLNIAKKEILFKTGGWWDWAF